ncbi:uncharacterized protein znf684.L [Xenopus laevis]|uniref:Uncharacterized protein znf684.L n=2 Tax=Xenopus laevis TaxID=8355 RepID=A0A1L8EUN7_XENLA|nr:uncharacterized protein znf684.L [Xenopus laevis]XP_018090898.1 uncharacterized protein znf684.L [Xenopus laevis]XP_018090899.1 uncharacterized protein znf684.L [Xenopus laevis]OCT63053.1 hypothetical protein XELAEV_18044148mg [Xenopus laevis]
MPHCVVSNCVHFNYKKSNLHGVALHPFPNDLSRIKLWLQQIGLTTDEIDYLAQKVVEGKRKKTDSHRMCSAHFTPNCYIVQDAKLVLRSDAIPTMFPGLSSSTTNQQNFLSPPNSSGCEGEVWPKCIVNGCRQPIGGVLFHTFPNNLQRIKQWLCQTGQDFGNIDAFAQKVLERRRSYDYCMCSAHFPPDCYIFQEGRAILRTNAMPTIFPSRPQAQQQLVWNVWPPLMVAQVPVSAGQNSAPTATSEQTPPSVPKPEKKSCETADKGVQWPEFESNFDGEPWKVEHDHHYHCRPLNPDEPLGHLNLNEFFPRDIYPPWFWTKLSSKSDNLYQKNFLQNLEADQAWSSVEKVLVLLLQHLNNSPVYQRILDNKPMTERIVNEALEVIYLLTGQEWTVVKKDSIQRGINQMNGEIPIKRGDVAVYFSMDEWEYLDEHRDRYLNLLMDEHLPFTQFKIPEDWGEEETTNQDMLDDPYVDPPLSEDQEDDDDDSSMSDWHPDQNYRPKTDASSSSDEESSAPKSKRRSIKKSRSESDSDNETSSEHSKSSNPLPADTQEPPDTEPRKCNGCDITFPNKSQLDLHLTLSPECLMFVGPEDEDEKPEVLPEKKNTHDCEECGKSFTRKAELRKHKKKHIKRKSIKCEDCGRRFFYRSQFLIHRRVHTGERPYQCKECGAQFGHKCSLVIHQKKHTGEARFTCGKCGRQFEAKAKLNKHVKIHERETVSCPQCSKCFTYKAALFKHLKVHKNS